MRAACPISVTRARAPASSAEASASISRKPSAWEKLVTEPEPLAVGNATGPSSPATSETSTNSLRPSSEAMRTGTSASMVRAASGGKTGTRADHRRDEGVEGEDRRGGKARQHGERLAADHGETKRLARLERDAMHEDAGCRASPRRGGRDRRRPSRCRRTARRCRRPRAPCAWQARAPPRRRERRRTEPARRPLPSTAAAMMAPLLS